MRLFLLGFTALVVLLPTLLILFAPNKSLRARMIFALLSFLSPLITFGLVRLVPDLANNAPDASQIERFLGLIASGSGFFVPWLIFAYFVHAHRE